MPAVNPGSKILLTGGSGFLGAWLVKTLLDRGFIVRTTVRREAQAEYLRNLLKEHEQHLEFSFVKDVAIPGAFDEAVVGVDAVIHAASPLADMSDLKSDPATLIDPAVNGTVGILKSAKAFGPTIKRIVITSSVAAVHESKEGYYVYTEEDVNHSSPKAVEQLSRDAPPFLKYTASKALAEQAAWKWVKENQPGFDIATILPCFIFGPIISETTADIGGSNALLLGQLKTAALAKNQFLESTAVVDVRDVATHHVDALIVPEAGGKRILSAADSVKVQDILDFVNERPIEGLTFPRGTPGAGKTAEHPYKYSSEFSKKLIGATYRPVENTIHDLLVDAVRIGWKQ